MSLNAPPAIHLTFLNYPTFGYISQSDLAKVFSKIADAGNALNPNYTLSAEYDSDNDIASLYIKYDDAEITIQGLFTNILLNKENLSSDSGVLYSGTYPNIFSDVIFTPNSILFDNRIYIQRIGDFFIASEFNLSSPQTYVIDIANKIGFATSHRLVFISYYASVGFVDRFKILGAKKDGDNLYAFPIGEGDFLYVPDRKYPIQPVIINDQNLWFRQSGEYEYFQWTLIMDLKEERIVDYNNL